jgi:hypothetical protein
MVEEEIKVILFLALAVIMLNGQGSFEHFFPTDHQRITPSFHHY